MRPQPNPLAALFFGVMSCSLYAFSWLSHFRLPDTNEAVDLILTVLLSALSVWAVVLACRAARNQRRLLGVLSVISTVNIILELVAYIEGVALPEGENGRYARACLLLLYFASCAVLWVAVYSYTPPRSA